MFPSVTGGFLEGFCKIHVLRKHFTVIALRGVGLSSSFIATAAAAMVIFRCCKPTRPATITSALCISAVSTVCTVSGRPSAVNFKLGYDSGSIE